MLKEVVNSLKRISLEKETLKAFQEHKEEAMDLNTQNQLFDQGIDSKGRDLGEYTPFTVQIKQAKGQKTDFITLKDDGDFYKGWFVKANKFPVLFDSRDSKKIKLVERFGSDIFGLTSKSVNELNEEYIKESVQEKFKSAVSKAFSILR